jgi:hypothetical protein
MDYVQRLLTDAYFHGLIVDPEDERFPGFPCLYRVSRPPGTCLDDLWLVWIGTQCFYRKPRTQVLYKDWDLAFATYSRDINFDAATGKVPRYTRKEVFKRAVLRCKERLKETISDFSKLKAATRVSFVEYREQWDASIPCAEDVGCPDDGCRGDLSGDR